MRSPPKKGPAQSPLPQQPPLLCRGLARLFSLTKSAFCISPISHLLFLQINHPLVLLGKHGPRSQASLSPQCTLMTICELFSLLFFSLFSSLWEALFKRVPFPFGPEVPPLNLQPFPACSVAFPSAVRLIPGCFLIGWRGEIAERVVWLLQGRHNFSCWSLHCPDSGRTAATASESVVQWEEEAIGCCAP